MTARSIECWSMKYAKTKRFSCKPPSLVTAEQDYVWPGLDQVCIAMKIQPAQRLDLKLVLGYKRLIQV